MQSPRIPARFSGEPPSEPALEAGALRLRRAVAELPLRYAPFFGRLCDLWQVSQPLLLSELMRARLPDNWSRTPLRGLRAFELRFARPAGSSRARLLHFAPGLHFPRHRHRGTERVLVLEGSYADSSGRELSAGDAQTMPPGSEHELRILGAAPCVAAISEQGVELGVLALLGSWLRR